MRPKTHTKKSSLIETLHAVHSPSPHGGPEIDDLATLASEICGTPYAAIHLEIGGDSVEISRVGGMSAKNTRVLSLLGNLKSATGTLAISAEDVDGRFVGIASGLTKESARFFSGVAIESLEGVHLGTLSVLDVVPRTLTAQQQNALRILGRHIASHLEIARLAKLGRVLLEKASDELGELPSTDAELRLVADQLPARVSYVTRDYTYAFANEAFYRELGEKPAAVVGRSVSQVIGKQEWTLWKPYLDQALRGTRVDTERLVMYPDGSRWLQAIFLPDKTATGEVQGVVIYLAEISRQRVAERALTESNVRSEAAAAGSGAGTFVKPPHGRGSFSEIPSQHDSSGDEAAIRHSADRLSIEDSEGTKICTERWMLARGNAKFGDDGEPLKLNGVVLDTTEGYEAEKALAVANAWTETVLRIAEIGRFDFDPNSHIVNGDAIVAALFGMTDHEAEEETAEMFTARIHPEDQARVADAFQRAAAEGSEFDIEYRVIVEL